MTFKFALKAGCAAVALAAAGGAYAGPFYLDIGAVNPPPGDKVCATCTSMKSEFLITYQSKTTIFDIDANGLDAGDLVSTSAGLLAGGGVGPLTNNRITGFNPGESFGTNSDNGYGPANHLISFAITGLGGIVSSVTGGIPSISYGPGLLKLFVTFNGVVFDNFMNIKIAGGGASGLGTLLFGEADFTGVPVGPHNDLFHSGNFSCLGSDSFVAILAGCGGPIQFVSSFDTNVTQSSVIPGPGGTFTIASDHDGSGTFNIPEPGSLALLGVALAGLGLTQRRRKAVQ